MRHMCAASPSPRLKPAINQNTAQHCKLVARDPSFAIHYTIVLYHRSSIDSRRNDHKSTPAKHGLAHQVCESISQKMKPTGDPRKTDLRVVF